jgi:hypothetical protein
VRQIPQVAACATGDLTPERFLDRRANTIYVLVVAAGHDQDALRPVILALVTELFGEEPVANASSSTARQTLNAGHQKAGQRRGSDKSVAGAPSSSISSIVTFRPRSSARWDGSRITGSLTTSGCAGDVVARRTVRRELNRSVR